MKWAASYCAHFLRMYLQLQSVASSPASLNTWQGGDSGANWQGLASSGRQATLQAQAQALALQLSLAGGLDPSQVRLHLLGPMTYYHAASDTQLLRLPSAPVQCLSSCRLPATILRAVAAMDWDMCAYMSCDGGRDIKVCSWVCVACRAHSCRHHRARSSRSRRRSSSSCSSSCRTSACSKTLRCLPGYGNCSTCSGHTSFAVVVPGYRRC